MFILALELQDYTFGFAGINVLWNELNGFPRGVSLLFGPIVYFYFLSQVNRSFHLKRKHLWHFLPYSIAFLYEFSAFIQGPEAVERQQSSTLTLVLVYVERVVVIVSYIYYLSRCMIIYRSFREWSINQFSNIEMIDFRWFRNFIYAMIFWLLFEQIMNIIDTILDLSFYQDWWWNLALVAVSFYIGLAGYAQVQPAKMQFDYAHPEEDNHGVDQNIASEQTDIAAKLKTLMEKDRLYLQPDLNLQELSQHLQTNTVKLSATINQVFEMNFNEYINTLRIDEFIRLYHEDSDRRYTILSIALDSGFNSKATFNRVFKKVKGTSPKEYLHAS